MDNAPAKLQRWRNAADRVGRFVVVAKSTFEEGRSELQRSSYNVMVTDLFLSAASEDNEDDFEAAEGLSLIAICREENPDSKIIAITGYTGEGIDIGALTLQRGADDFISDNWVAIRADALLEIKLRMFAELLDSYSSGARSR